MAQDDVIAVLGTALSSFFVAVGFLWNIGFLQIISSVLAGSFATYFVQYRLQNASEKRRVKRENVILMRDEIYGSLFELLNEILEKLRRAWGVSGGDIQQKIMSHHLFYGINDKLRNKISDLINNLEIYQTIHYSADKEVDAIIFKEVKSKFDVQPRRSNYVLWRLKMGEVMLKAISLKEALFLGKSPLDILPPYKGRYVEAEIEVSVAGHVVQDHNKVEFIVKSALQKIEQNPMLREEKRQREILIKEISTLCDQIRPFIGLQ